MPTDAAAGHRGRDRAALHIISDLNDLGTALASHTSEGLMGVDPIWPTWIGYTFWFQSNSWQSDQHHWRDPIIDRLWLRAQRLPAKLAAPLWRQLADRTITQADFLPVADHPEYFYADKRVAGFSEGALPLSPRQRPADRLVSDRQVEGDG
jgi:hypothetical protein